MSKIASHEKEQTPRQRHYDRVGARSIYASTTGLPKPETVNRAKMMDAADAARRRWLNEMNDPTPGAAMRRARSLEERGQEAEDRGYYLQVIFYRSAAHRLKVWVRRQLRTATPEEGPGRSW